MTEVESLVHLTMTRMEARYLKSLVGFVEGGNLPHSVWAHKMYGELRDIVPEMTVNRPWGLGNFCVKPMPIDWTDLG